MPELVLPVIEHVIVSIEYSNTEEEKAQAPRTPY